MTPDADARTQFRQAIAGRNVPLADRAARRAPLTLDQVAEYVVLLAEKRDERFGRAASRLVIRLREAGATVAEERAAINLLQLAADDPDEARAGLTVLCRRG